MQTTRCYAVATVLYRLNGLTKYSIYYIYGRIIFVHAHKSVRWQWRVVRIFSVTTPSRPLLNICILEFPNLLWVFSSQQLHCTLKALLVYCRKTVRRLLTRSLLVQINPICILNRNCTTWETKVLRETCATPRKNISTFCVEVCNIYAKT